MYNWHYLIVGVRIAFLTMLSTVLIVRVIDDVQALRKLIEEEQNRCRYT